MPRNALPLPGEIGVLIADGQNREICNTERERAVMQMRREHRRRQAGQLASPPALLLGDREPGA